MLENTLQKNIKRKLKKQNLSIAELERRAGLRHSVINIIHGRSKNPSVKVAFAIAKEFGCSMEELLQDNDTDASDNKGNLETFDIANKLGLEKDYTPTKRNTPFEPKLGADIFNCMQTYLGKNNLTPAIMEVMNSWMEIYNYCYGTENKTCDARFVEWFMERNFAQQKTTFL